MPSLIRPRIEVSVDREPSNNERARQRQDEYTASATDCCTCRYRSLDMPAANRNEIPNEPDAPARFMAPYEVPDPIGAGAMVAFQTPATIAATMENGSDPWCLNLPEWTQFKPDKARTIKPVATRFMRNGEFAPGS